MYLKIYLTQNILLSFKNLVLSPKANVEAISPIIFLSYNKKVMQQNGNHPVSRPIRKKTQSFLTFLVNQTEAFFLFSIIVNHVIVIACDCNKMLTLTAF